MLSALPPSVCPIRHFFMDPSASPPSFQILLFNRKRRQNFKSKNSNSHIQGEMLPFF